MLYVMTLKNDEKFEEELSCCFKIDLLFQKYIMFEWRVLKKSTEELSFLTLEGDAKFEEKLTCGLKNDMKLTMKNDAKFEKEFICQFKTDMKNLMNFDPSIWKCQKFTL